MNILELKLKPQIDNSNRTKYPKWYFDIVKNPQNIENLLFYNLLPAKFYSSNISTNNIVGTFHQSYYDHSWLSMFRNMPRNHNNLDSKDIIMFIQNESIGEKKRVAKYGDEYYIISGNHRICHAKFLKIDILTCNITEYFFDHEAYKLYQELLKIKATCTIVDKNNWNISIKNIYITIYKFNEVHRFLDIYKKIKYSKLKQWLYQKFYKPEEYTHVTFSDESNLIKKLKDTIIYYKLK